MTAATSPSSPTTRATGRYPSKARAWCATSTVLEDPLHCTDQQHLTTTMWPDPSARPLASRRNGTRALWFARRVIDDGPLRVRRLRSDDAQRSAGRNGRGRHPSRLRCRRDGTGDKLLGPGSCRSPRAVSVFSKQASRKSMPLPSQACCGVTEATATVPPIRRSRREPAAEGAECAPTDLRRRRTHTRWKSQGDN